MSSGPRYKNEIDGLLSQGIRRLEQEGLPMTPTTPMKTSPIEVIETVQGLIAGMKGSNLPGPYIIVVPAEIIGMIHGGTSLTQHLEALPEVASVVGPSEKDKGFSIKQYVDK